MKIPRRAPKPDIKFYFRNEAHQYEYWMRGLPVAQLRLYRVGVTDGVERLKNSFSNPSLGPAFSLFGIAIPLSILFLSTPPSEFPELAGVFADVGNRMRMFSFFIVVGLALSVAGDAIWRQWRGGRLMRWATLLDLLIADAERAEKDGAVGATSV